MTRGLRVASIVEGHGEVSAVPKLLRRIARELLDDVYLDIVTPIRHKRDKFGSAAGLRGPVTLAARTLRSRRPPLPGIVLILLDGDGEPPCRLGPQVLAAALEIDPDADIGCVVADVMYESWFVAAADSLERHLRLTEEDLRFVREASPDSLASKRSSWVAERFLPADHRDAPTPPPSYRKTRDQPAMTEAMDLRVCRRRSPSFDKLCRELERRLNE